MSCIRNLALETLLKASFMQEPNQRLKSDLRWDHCLGKPPPVALVGRHAALELPGGVPRVDVPEALLGKAVEALSEHVVQLAKGGERCVQVGALPENHNLTRGKMSFE